MIEQKQLYYHNPDEGEIGDCFRTCVACVLNIKVGLVPHFVLNTWGTVDKDNSEEPLWHKGVNRWLISQDEHFRYHEYPLQCTREQLGIYLKRYYRDQYIIIGCQSKNSGHAVVMRNDDYMWDPSKDNSGCTGPMEDGYYWIGFFALNTEI